MLKISGLRGLNPLFFICSLTTISIIVILSAGCIDLTHAYIPDSLLTEGWHENVSCRETDAQSFGLEKWASMRYEYNDTYDAWLIITTMKTLTRMDDQQLQEKTLDTIHTALPEGMVLNESNNITGARVLKNRHKTRYMIYEGGERNDTGEQKVKIIGEMWHCKSSGTAVICVGMAFITDQLTNATGENMAHWATMVMDESGTIGGWTGENGRIYSVVDH